MGTWNSDKPQYLSRITINLISISINARVLAKFADFWIPHPSPHIAYIRTACISTVCTSTICISTVCISTVCISTICISTICISTVCTSTVCISTCALSFSFWYKAVKYEHIEMSLHLIERFLRLYRPRSCRIVK